METALRPLNLGEILDRTAQLYRENFLLFAGIFALYSGVALVLGLLLVGLTELLRIWHLTAQLQWLVWTCTGVEWLVLFLLAGAAVAAISRAVAWVHLGQPATIRGSYATILPRLGQYLWLMAITAFIVWTPLALLYGGYFWLMTHYVQGFGTPAGLAAQQAAMTDPKTLAIIGVASLGLFVLIFPVGIYTVFMALRYALAVPACVVENLKAWPSLRRGVALAKGSKGRIFVLGLLIGAIKLGLVGITQIFFIATILKHNGQISAGASALSQVVGFFTTTFLGPIYAAGITLFYYDQRVRKEGYDIEWMMAAAGLTVPELKAVAAKAPVEAAPPESGAAPELPLAPQEPQGAATEGE
jgi:hypothetical protein